MRDQVDTPQTKLKMEIVIIMLYSGLIMDGCVLLTLGIFDLIYQQLLMVMDFMARLTINRTKSQGRMRF